MSVSCMVMKHSKHKHFKPEKLLKIYGHIHITYHSDSHLPSLNRHDAYNSTMLITYLNYYINWSTKPLLLTLFLGLSIDCACIHMKESCTASTLQCITNQSLFLQ